MNAFFTFLVINFFLFTSLPYARSSEVLIPDSSEWTDHGVVLTPSSSGWDIYFGAQAPATVIKKGDTYFMYYVGSVGPRSTDGGPKDRALGVATSRDGVNFTKHFGNPVLRFQPHNNQEEGIFSAAAVLDDNEDIILYYGAIWAANSTTEEVDVFINAARSSDGFNFKNLGTVYRSGENGGENWPHAALRVPGGKWHVWYGRDNPRSLLVGNSIISLQKVGNLVPRIRTQWFGLQAIYLGNDKIALFVDNPIKVWITRLSSLNSFQGPAATYSLTSNRNMFGIAVYLDRTTNKWYMYYRTGAINPLLDDAFVSGHDIRLRTAPVRYVDFKK